MNEIEPCKKPEMCILLKDHIPCKICPNKDLPRADDESTHPQQLYIQKVVNHINIASEHSPPIGQQRQSGPLM